MPVQEIIYVDETASGYSFSKNFFSDLGRSVSFSGESNLVSFILFNSCIILSGFAFILFFFEFYLLFRRNVINRYLAMFGTLFGVLGGACLMGVGLFPIDLYHESHKLSAIWTFRFFFPCTLLYGIALFRSPRFVNLMAYGYLTWSFLVLSYVLVSEIGSVTPSYQTVDALIFQIVAQKLIVFTFILNIFYQTFHISSFFKKRIAKKQAIRQKIN